VASEASEHPFVVDAGRGGPERASPTDETGNGCDGNSGSSGSPLAPDISTRHEPEVRMNDLGKPMRPEVASHHALGTWRTTDVVVML
jgi:hypothetical protein